ncbi:MAG: BMP family ABC transporter substrate-binding protein [Anaerolineales bacterium]
MKRKNRKSHFLALMLLAAAAAGCSGGAGTATATPSPTEQAAPSATPTPEPYAVIMAPDPAPTAAVELAITAVEDFAGERGWEIRRVTPGVEVLGGDRLGGPRLFAAIGSGIGGEVYAAAQNRPDIRFLAVEETGIEPLDNLLVIGGDFRQDQAAFMAGLLAGIENRNDYVGWIGEEGTTRGKIFQTGFRHGIRYVCPRCRLFDFELPPSADASAGISAAGQLIQNYIDTASAIPGAAGEAGLADLAGNGVRVAGAGTDFYRLVFGSGSGTGAEYVLGEAAFRPDILLAERLGRFADGEGFSEPVAYSLENGGLVFADFINDWVSSARRIYLNGILEEVAAGRLDIGIDPETGEER